MTAETETTEDTLDELAGHLNRITARLWDVGIEQRRIGAISREEFVELKDNCRALSRRTVELITTASRINLERLAGHLDALGKITRDMKKAKERVENVERGISVAVASVAAVSLLLAAVAAPNPGTIAAAAAGVADLVASIG